MKLEKILEEPRNQTDMFRCSGSHSKVDETQSLLQRFLFGSFVVGVRLLIELCDVLHHLMTQKKGGNKII